MLLYKIIPDEFSAFQRLRPTPVGEHIPEWRKHLAEQDAESGQTAEASVQKQREHAQAPQTDAKPASSSEAAAGPTSAPVPISAAPTPQNGPEPACGNDFSDDDNGLGMVEKALSSILGEDEPEEEDYDGRMR